MTKKTKTQEKEKTIAVTLETWKKLNHLQTDCNYRSMEELLLKLIGEKQ